MAAKFGPELPLADHEGAESPFIFCVLSKLVEGRFVKAAATRSAKFKIVALVSVAILSAIPQKLMAFRVFSAASKAPSI